MLIFLFLIHKHTLKYSPPPLYAKNILFCNPFPSIVRMSFVNVHKAYLHTGEPALKEWDWLLKKHEFRQEAVTFQLDFKNDPKSTNLRKGTKGSFLYTIYLFLTDICFVILLCEQ